MTLAARSNTHLGLAAKVLQGVQGVDVLHGGLQVGPQDLRVEGVLLHRQGLVVKTLQLLQKLLLVGQRRPGGGEAGIHRCIVGFILFTPSVPPSLSRHPWCRQHGIRSQRLEPVPSPPTLLYGHNAGSLYFRII